MAVVEVRRGVEGFATFALPGGRACALRVLRRDSFRGDTPRAPRAWAAPPLPLLVLFEGGAVVDWVWVLADGAEASSLRWRCCALRGGVGWALRLLRRDSFRGDTPRAPRVWAAPPLPLLALFEVGAAVDWVGVLADGAEASSLRWRCCALRGGRGCVAPLKEGIHFERPPVRLAGLASTRAGVESGGDNQTQRFDPSRGSG